MGPCATKKGGCQAALKFTLIPSCPIQESTQSAAPAGVAQFAKRLRFNLPDPLTGNPKHFTDLFQCPRPAIIQAKSETEYIFLPVCQRVEYILMQRKPGGYRTPDLPTRLLSIIAEEDHKRWFQQIWTGLTGASTRHHPAPYPLELAVRLIRMFSFVGDTVLDPFLGTGTTTLAAAQTGRNSIGFEIEPGDEVITTPYSWGASTSCILHCGAVPVFTDVDPELVFREPSESVYDKALASLGLTPGTVWMNPISE